MLLMSLVAASALVLTIAGVVPEARFGQLVVLLAAVHLLTIATQIGHSARWRDVIRRHAWGIALLAVCAVAVAVRLPGFASDLGHTPLDIDEQRVAANVRHYFLTGEVRHRHIEQYPGVVFWLFSASSLLFFVRALMNGIVTAVNDLPLETFARAARLANIWVAAASVGMTGLIGWRLSGKAAAVLGALLVAVVPLSVESTILVRNDAGMVLAVVAATYAALAYHDTGKLAWIAASGVFAGLAAGIKYTAVFTLAPVLIAALSVSPLQKQVRAAVLGVLAFGLAIGVSHHFIWADFPNFLNQVAEQYAFTGPGHPWSTDKPERFYVMTLVTAGPGWPMRSAGGSLHRICACDTEAEAVDIHQFPSHIHVVHDTARSPGCALGVSAGPLRGGRRRGCAGRVPCARCPHCCHLRQRRTRALASAA